VHAAIIVVTMGREERDRQARREEVFGEVLPEDTADDRDPSSGDDKDDSSDEWLRANVPPHHG
jgi:hypothetical protein